MHIHVVNIYTIIERPYSVSAFLIAFKKYSICNFSYTFNLAQIKDRFSLYQKNYWDTVYRLIED